MRHAAVAQQVPETAGNLVFGGVQRNRIYICASTSIYACYVNTQGAARP
jgi:gluconolactonase